MLLKLLILHLSTLTALIIPGYFKRGEVRILTEKYNFYKGNDDIINDDLMALFQTLQSPSKNSADLGFAFAVNPNSNLKTPFLF